MSQLWHQLAGVLGSTAVALGAYGSHGFRPKDPYFLTVFDRANKYQFLNALLLLATPLVRRPNLVGGLATASTVLFSGSCYLVALKEDRSVGKLAPFGGMLAIAAWLAVAL